MSESLIKPAQRTEAEARAAKSMRDRAAQAACRYCANGALLSWNFTHSIFGNDSALHPVFCEARAIRALPLFEDGGADG